MTPAKCLKLFGKHLTEYEKTEILDYPHVYYFGEGAKKVKADPAKTNGNAKDDQSSLSAVFSKTSLVVALRRT